MVYMSTTLVRDVVSRPPWSDLVEGPVVRDLRVMVAALVYGLSALLGVVTRRVPPSIRLEC